MWKTQSRPNWRLAMRLAPLLALAAGALALGSDVAVGAGTPLSGQEASPVASGCHFD